MKQNIPWFIHLKTVPKVILLICLWAFLFHLIFRVIAIRASDYHAQIGPDVEAQLIFIRAKLHEPDSIALR